MEIMAAKFDRFETVNTHELKTGDIIRHSNAVFKLTERKEWPARKGLDDADNFCVTFKTELLEFKPGNMPKHWAETWVVQGNKLARWNRYKG